MPRYIYLRRFVVNCALGAALMLPICLLIGGLTVNAEDRVVVDWTHISWIWAGIAVLYGAASFQYLSIRFARKRGVNVFLAGLAGIAGFIIAQYALDALYFAMMQESAPVTFLTTFMIVVGGGLLGSVLWMRANIVLRQHMMELDV